MSSDDAEASSGAVSIGDTMSAVDTRQALAYAMAVFRETPSIVNLAHVFRGMRAHAIRLGYKFRMWTECVQIDGNIEGVRLYFTCRDEKENPITFSANPSVDDCASIVDGTQHMVDSVLNMRPHDEHLRLRWYQSLHDIAEEGERLGVGMEYVQVLQETAKRVASNALEHIKEKPNG